MSDFHPAAKIARLDAIAATTWPDRINRALTQLDLARSPLRAVQGGSGGSGIGDPTGEAAVNASSDPKVTSRRLVDLILLREKLGREVGAILDEWAASPTKATIGASENSHAWCANHLRHGAHQPVKVRGGGGKRGRDGNCGWCQTVLDDWGTLPNHALIRLHDRGIRITEGTYAQQLNVTHRRMLKPGDAWT